MKKKMNSLLRCAQPHHHTCSEQFSVLVPLYVHVRVSDRRQLALEVRRLRLDQVCLRPELCLELRRARSLLDVHVIVLRLRLNAALNQLYHGRTLDRGLATTRNDIG